MYLKSKIPLIATVGIILVNVIYCVLLFFLSFKPSIDVIQNERMSRVSVLIESILQEQYRRLASVAELLSTRKQLNDLVEKGSRDNLIELLQSTYTLQHENYAIDVLNIIRPPSKMLIRFHDLKKFNDDVSDRNMVIKINASKKTIYGIEVAHSGLAIRAMAPLLHEKNLMGIIEVGSNFDDIITVVKNITGFDLAIFVNLTLLNKISKGLPPAEPEKLVGGMRALYCHNWQKIHTVITDNELRQTHDTISMTKVIGNKSNGVILIPLQDFSGQFIGVMVAVREFETYHSLKNKFIADAAFLSILNITFLVGMILILFRGWILRPLMDFIIQLEKLNLGKIDEIDKSVIDEFIHSPNELGDISRTLSTLMNSKSKLSNRDKERE
jgi:hypothetical protein